MTTADLLVAKTQANVAEALCQSIVSIADESLQNKSSFSIALSGGSLPSFLSALPLAFEKAQVDPQWSKWHVFLADERCVPLTSEDSNLAAIQEHFLHLTSIPTSQIHGINQDLLLLLLLAAAQKHDGENNIDKIAEDYQATLERVLKELTPCSDTTYSFLDLAVLGFGPDGHTCSLFPNHPLLEEDTKWVAAITDSPKPPSDRITLTFPFLNQCTHNVIICGAGSSKRPIVEQVFQPHDIYPLHSSRQEEYSNKEILAAYYTASISHSPPPPFPCAMVHPMKSLTWILDSDAIPSSWGLLSNVVAEVDVFPTKSDVGTELCRQIVAICQQSIQQRNIFSIALSGGSLPALLSKLPETFRQMNVPPHYEKWHIVVADERGVPESHPDSNLRAIKRSFLTQVGVSVPARQVHGIDIVSLGESIQVAALSYQTTLLSVLELCEGGLLDLVLLGFGEDGHTCSLFPNHPLLLEREAYVAALTDSPKPPSYRITFTLRTLNERSRNILFCGTGESKSPILHEILQGAYHRTTTSDTNDKEEEEEEDGHHHHQRLEANVYPKFPCGMARPKERLVYLADAAAMKQVFVASSEESAEHDEETNTGPRLVARRGSSVLPKPAIAKLYVHSHQADVGAELCAQIVRYAATAIAERSAFTVALSGGSLPGMLSKLPQAFEDAGVDPHYHMWHVLLADERCVPEDHPESNMHALNRYLLGDLYERIPHQHIYGLDQVSLAESPQVAAQDYERKVKTALGSSGGMLDLAVLGFGPDGHTCSLFPNHPLLKEDTKWVAAITDSPKAPSNRITMTFPLLNQHTRNVLFCGTGNSKSAILRDIFPSIKAKGLHMEMDLVPTKYPCSMIRPQGDLVYIVDEGSMEKVLDCAPTAPPAQFAKVLVAKNKEALPDRVLPLLVQQSQKAIRERGIFTIALSGGSIPQLLSGLADAFRHLGIVPQWDKWHVLLADERCVPGSDPDSNMGALRSHLLDFINIPPSQIYGIDESKLVASSTQDQARDYEAKVRKVLARSDGVLDVALLGFGPDGHTCSLFPGREQLQERLRWVTGIDDSPKPPPRRITLTLGLLNEWTRTIIFCGAGESKEPVLSKVFQEVQGRHGTDIYVKIQNDPPPFPCAMVTPQTHLFWVVDAAAMPSRHLLPPQASP